MENGEGKGPPGRMGQGGAAKNASGQKPENPGLRDREFMRLAIDQAEKAARAGEVPVGAVAVLADGRAFPAHNQTIGKHDPTAHAEISAIRAACAAEANYRLPGSTLYVTVEPCILCMAAIVHARVGRVVFGAPDPRWGGAGSLYAFQEDGRLNHRPAVTAGVLKESCREIIQEFFREKRARARENVK